MNAMWYFPEIELESQATFVVKHCFCPPQQTGNRWHRLSELVFLTRDNLSRSNDLFHSPLWNGSDCISACKRKSVMPNRVLVKSMRSWNKGYLCSWSNISMDVLVDIFLMVHGGVFCSFK